jgi:hypothetical protein
MADKVKIGNSAKNPKRKQIRGCLENEQPLFQNEFDTV